MECMFCGHRCQKAGKQKNGQQRHYCKRCNRYQQYCYKNTAFKPSTCVILKKLLCEGVGIRGIGRVLDIANNTVMSRIKKIASSIPKPPIPIGRESFELDELRTFVGYKSNEIWVAYAICPETKEVVDFIVGRRSKRTLAAITGNLLLSEVSEIKTDKLNIYRSLIPKNKHIVHNRCTNRIERHNLNLRTHLKRLSRRTICLAAANRCWKHA